MFQGGATKRQKEMRRKEHQQEKEARKQERLRQKEAQPKGDGTEDPDLAGIVPGPQPRLEE